MNKIQLLSIGLILLGIGLFSGYYWGKKSVSLQSNNELFPSVGLKGSFGQDLGKLVEVKGTVLEESRSKADNEKVRMKVIEMNGKKLNHPVIIALESFSWSGIPLPKPGDKVSYIGYESGAMTGIPEKAFQYLPRVATTAFFFEKVFIICKKLD